MPLALLSYLLITATVISLPIMLIVLVGRKWIDRNVGRSMVAISFGTSTAYALWHIDRFDVWRHGMPSLSQLAPYAAYVSVFAALGWMIGSLLRPRGAPRPP